MKKLLYSLLTLAAALTVASCQKEQPTSPYEDGDAVNASFAVSMSDALTKAFADGTTVDTVDAALYEVGGTNDAPTYTFIAQADPAKITDLKATVEINGKLKKGKEYRVVFWASKKAAATTGAETTSSPYAVTWDPAPVVTVTPTGAANDETRDAFFGTFDTGVVMGDVTADKDIPLVRPFSQVNVLVPVGNITDGASITSSMTVKQAPTTLNLNTGETGTPADYVFAVAPMAEPAFGGYAQSHKYVAMNYVLVDQDATASHYHDVAFSVTAGDDSTGDTPKSLTIPLKANVRTNIVGNIFESFGFSGGVVVTPGAGEAVATDIRIAVGTAGTSADDPIPVSSNGEWVTFAISRDVTGETPAITYDPEGIVTATWESSFNGIKIVPLVDNGTAVVTVTFAEVTKTTYAEGKINVYVKIGDGNTPTAAAPTFSPEAGAVEEGTKVTISAEEGADIYFTTDGTDPTKESTKYTADTEITINEETTVKAIAVVSGKKNSPVATAEYTIKAAVEQVAKPTFNPAAGAVDAGTTVTISTTTEGAAIHYTTNGDTPTASSTLYTAPVAINTACTLKAIAVKEGMTDSDVFEAAYTIKEKVEAPTFTPAAGTYEGAQSVTIICATEGAAISYKLGDGEWRAYSEPISVSESVTISAKATKTGMTDSEVSEATFNITTTPATDYDVLNFAFTGLSSETSGYATWSEKNGSFSSAVYAGNSNGGVTYIQLRKSSPSGIVSTTSGGVLRKVAVTWSTATDNTSGRSLTVYGNNRPYSNSEDLYDSKSTQVELGTIVYGTSTELEITDNYEYVGIVSSGAVYLDEIDIYWDNQPSRVEAPTNVSAASSGTSINVTWTDVVSNVAKYVVTCTGQSPQVIDQGVQAATFSNLSNGTYSVTIQAVPSSNSHASSVVSEVGDITVSGAVDKYYKKVTSIIAGGTYLIVAGNYAMAHPTGSATITGTSVTIAEEGILQNTETQELEFVIDKCTVEGFTDNYTIAFSVDDKTSYVYAVADNSTKFNKTDNPVYKNKGTGVWTFTSTNDYAGGGFLVENVEYSSSNRAILQNGSGTFGFYAKTNTKYYAIDLYKLQTD